MDCTWELMVYSVVLVVSLGEVSVVARHGFLTGALDHNTPR